MTRLFALCSLLFVMMLAACSGSKSIVGSGVLIDDQRALTTFDQVVVDVPVNVDIRYGSTQQVNVYAQGQVLPVLQTNVKGETLTISMSEKAQMDGATNVKIMLPALKSVTHNSQGDISIMDFKGDKLALTHSGQGNLTVRDITYEDVKVKHSGQGDVTLSGTSEDLEVDGDGAGNVNASRLMVKDAKVTNKGAGDISVTVENDLKAAIKGAGNINYKGDPKVDLSDDGAGSLQGNN